MKKPQILTSIRRAHREPTQSLPVEFRATNSQPRFKRSRLLATIIAALLTLTVNAEILNGGFETGSLTNWTLTGNGAFGDSPRSEVRFNQPTEGSYYADSGFDAGGVWVETNTGVLQSAIFSLGLNEAIQFDIGGWSKWGGGGFEHCYVGLYLAADGSELDRAWTPNGNDAVLANLEHGTNINIDVYIKVVDDGTNAGFAWLSVDNFRILDTADPNFDFENGYLNWNVAGPAWGSGSVTTNYLPVHNVGFGCHGDYFAVSRLGGEAATGTIKSINFTLPKDSQLNFLICGWSSWAGGGGEYNYVTLRKVSDDTQIGDAVYAPGINSFVDAVISNKTGSDQEVYIEAVDNSDGTGYAWFGIDYFQIKTPIPEPPQGVSATGGSTNDRVIVTWFFDSEADKYRIFRNTVADTNMAIDISGELGDVTQYDDTTALNNSNYYYWVQAGNSHGWSPLSDYAIGFRTDSTGPDKPSNISPADGSTPEFPISLAASAYSDSGGWPFAISEWQISSSTSFSPRITISAGAVTNITPAIGDLYTGTNYWSVRYGNDRNKWSDWSDTTTFIVNRDMDSPFYFYETFNNVSGSGDVNKEYNASGRQLGFAAPLNYVSQSTTEVGDSATNPNKLTLSGVDASCSPNYSFTKSGNFKIEFDITPSADGTAICFGKASKNAAPNSPGGMSIVFYGNGSGRYDVYDSATLDSVITNSSATGTMHVMITASTEDFDNSIANIAMFINGEPIPLHKYWVVGFTNLPDYAELHWGYFYIHEKVTGFDENYITFYNNNGTAVIDNFRIQETTPNQSVYSWSNDSDIRVDSSRNYTHAYNLSTNNSVNVNGVTFNGTDKYQGVFPPNGVPAVTGTNWHFYDPDGYFEEDYLWSAATVQSGAAGYPSGSGKDLLRDVLFDKFSGFYLSLDVTSGTTNVLTFYKIAWIAGGSPLTFAGNDGGAPQKIDMSAFAAGDGMTIDYTYVAPDNGIFNLVLGPIAGGTIAAFSNYELTNNIAPVLETIDLLDFGELIAGETKTFQLPVFNVGAGTVSGEVSGILSPFSLSGGSNYSAKSESPDFVSISFTPTAEEDYTNIIFLIGSGGSTQVELKGHGVPEPISVIGYLLSVFGIFIFAKRKK